MARLRGQTSTVTTGPGTIVASTAAPASPHVGQRWFKPETAVTYQYTSDGATNFWLDISSGGIGQNAVRSADIVGDIDPHLEINPAGGVGSVYYNREAHRYFICTDATSNANVWAGRYVGFGGLQQTYDTGSNTYFMSHTFLSGGIFHMDVTTTCSVLVVGGGGAGGPANSAGGGGGGAGEFMLNASLSVTAGKYQVTVGRGGISPHNSSGIVVRGKNGSSSIFSSITALGGGGGGAQNTERTGAAGGSGGGAGYNASSAASGGGSGTGGNNGGAFTASTNSGGGGGGDAAVGGNSATTQGGAGGNGTANAYRTGSNVTYAAGGGGGGYGDSKGGAGGSSNIGGKGGDTADGNVANDGVLNTGSGGGGGGSNTGTTGAGRPGSGADGIVIIRYALNP